MTRARLVIVPRHDQQLFDYLRRRLSGVSRVEVILDRRAGERRRSVKPTVDRRRGERRTPLFRVATTLGCTLIAVDPEAPAPRAEPGATAPDTATPARTLWPALRVQDLPPPSGYPPR